MVESLALHARTMLAPDTQGLQTNILGLPLWVWLIVLIIIVILLYLLLRPSPPEVEQYNEIKTSPVVEKTTESATPAPEAAAAQPEAAPAAVTSPFLEEADSLDDLTIIEGIGPKISGVLRDAGINSFQKLADTSPARIAEILKAAGITLFDASTWPEQASLILAAKWTELRALQEKLIAGRRE